MKKKVAELEGAELDYWVAMALGKPNPMIVNGPMGQYAISDDGGCNYSYDWSQGGPIIERELIQICAGDGFWNAAKTNDIRSGHWDSYSNYMMGDTALVAAMRCFVAIKFGEEVEDI